MSDTIQEAYDAYMACSKNQSEAARKLGLPRGTYRKRLDRYFKQNGSEPTPQVSQPKVKVAPVTKPIVKAVSTPTIAIKGCKRAEVVAKHDAPTVIRNLLAKFIKMMRTGMSYEESEVKRFCRITSHNLPYWNEITEEQEYKKYQGYTENDLRIWGLEDEIEWNSENISGFRRAV